ncbi:MAG: monodechloroaminopyrrolnitrin synthase PrnB family protein [Rivularia sp. (in: cyanobacteria)]
MNIVEFDSYFSNYNHSYQENAMIAELDPIKSDADIVQLPYMNCARDIKSIISRLQRLIPTEGQIEDFNIHEARAVVRDLGMFAGSIKKYGIEPVEVIPQLETVLIQLGTKTDMVPRDTLIHYTVWNPDGERKRRYTLHLDETKIIESSKIAIPRLEMGIYKLLELHKIPFESPDFIRECEICASYLNGMVEAIVYTIKNVSRKVFAENLRPYFDSFMIQGKEYLGPGAVEMPLLIFDHFLWSSECRDVAYLYFKQSFISYFLPNFRKLYIDGVFATSLLSKLIDKLNNASSFDENLVASAAELMKLFKILIKFRKPHIKVVNQAYTLAENRQRETGSGGYKCSTLIHITELTENAVASLQNAIKEHEILHNHMMIS